MTIGKVPASQLRASCSAAPPGWRRRSALILALAAQLVTIADLAGVHPVAVTWPLLLLAIAPVSAAAVALAPVPVSRLAAVAGAIVLVAGLAGQLTHDRGVVRPGTGGADGRRGRALARAGLSRGTGVGR